MVLLLINGFGMGWFGLIHILLFRSFWSSAWKSWMPITIFGPSMKSAQWNSAKRCSAKIRLNCFCWCFYFDLQGMFSNTLVNLRFPSWTRKHKSWRRRWCKVIRLRRRFKICKESTFSAHGHSPTLLWWGWTQNWRIDVCDHISQLSGAEVVNRWYQEVSFHDYHSEAPNSRSGKSARKSQKDQNIVKLLRQLQPIDLESKQDTGGWLWQVCFNIWRLGFEMGSNSQRPNEWPGGGVGSLRPPGQHWGRLCCKCASFQQKYLHLLIWKSCCDAWPDNLKDRVVWFWCQIYISEVKTSNNLNI